jgi:hypothetical protein
MGKGAVCIAEKRLRQWFHCRSFLFWKGSPMHYDAFSKCHPLVNFLFFVGAIGAGVMIQHPAYLLAGIVTGVVYYLLLNGRKGFK